MPLSGLFPPRNKQQVNFTPLNDHGRTFREHPEHIQFAPSQGAQRDQERFAPTAFQQDTEHIASGAFQRGPRSIFPARHKSTTDLSPMRRYVSTPTRSHDPRMLADRIGGALPMRRYDSTPTRSHEPYYPREMFGHGPVAVLPVSSARAIPSYIIPDVTFESPSSDGLGASTNNLELPPLEEPVPATEQEPQRVPPLPLSNINEEYSETASVVEHDEVDELTLPSSAVSRRKRRRVRAPVKGCAVSTQTDAKWTTTPVLEEDIVALKLENTRMKMKLEQIDRATRIKEENNYQKERRRRKSKESRAGITRQRSVGRISLPAIVFEDSNDGISVRSGTIDGLLDYLVQKFDQEGVHFEFTVIFLFCYRAFLSVEEVAEHLVMRLCDVDAADKVFPVMKRHVEWYPNDFHPRSASERIFREACQSILPMMGREAQGAELTDLLDRASLPDPHTSPYLFPKCPDTRATFKRKRLRPNEDMDPATVTISFMDVPSDDIAAQLAYTEACLYSCVLHSELLDSSWSKDAGDSAPSPNMGALSQHFNNVSLWVQTDILACGDLEKRVMIVEKCIEIAHMSLNINNFNGVMEMYSGLSSAPVGRLKKTWAAVNPRHIAYFTEVQNALSPMHAFKNYRDLVREVKGSPMIPYLGVYVADVIRTNEGNDTIDETTGHINFFKYYQIAHVVDDALAGQPSAAAFKPVANVPLYWVTSPRPSPNDPPNIRLRRLDEKELFEVSLKLEPRVATPSPRKNKRRGSFFNVFYHEDSEQPKSAR